MNPYMTNFYFGENGSVSRTPMKNIAFTLENISTPAKGSIYSLVIGNGQRLNRSLQSARILMAYHVKDAKIPDDAYFETYTDFLNENPYGFYPLIRQILLADEFIENQSDDDHRIYLSAISYYDKSLGREESIDKITDKKIRQFAEKYDIMTDLSKVAGDSSFLCYEPYSKKKGHAYKFTDDFDLSKCGYNAFVCFPEIETLYSVSSFVYQDLSSLVNVTIDIVYDRRMIKRSKNIAEGINQDRINDSFKYSKTYYANTVDQIFKLCIYVPQLIMIERAIYNVEPTITITVEKNNISGSITIKKSEYTVDLSIFEILTRMCNLIR